MNVITLLLTLVVIYGRVLRFKVENCTFTNQKFQQNCMEGYVSYGDVPSLERIRVKPLN